MEQNLKKLIDYAVKRELQHLTLTLDELKELQQIDKELIKIKKAINILKKRICIHNQYYVTYDMLADKPLTEEQYKLLKEVLEDDK